MITTPGQLDITREVETMSWDQAREEAKAAQSGGIFFSLKDDGDSAKVVFLGEPVGHKTIWIDGGTQRYNEHNPLHKGVRPSQKFKLNVYNTEEKVVQIWDMSATTLSAIDKAVNGTRDKAGKIDPDLPGHGLNAIYKIVRSGQKTKTTYSVNHIKPLTDEQIATIAALDLHDLAPPPEADANAPDDDEDVPF